MTTNLYYKKITLKNLPKNQCLLVYIQIFNCMCVCASFIFFFSVFFCLSLSVQCLLYLPHFYMEIIYIIIMMLCILYTKVNCITYTVRPHLSAPQIYPVPSPSDPQHAWFLYWNKSVINQLYIIYIIYICYCSCSLIYPVRSLTLSTISSRTDACACADISA